MASLVPEKRLEMGLKATALQRLRTMVRQDTRDGIGYGQRHNKQCSAGFVVIEEYI
jgi:hypothetical protein